MLALVLLIGAAGVWLWRSSLTPGLEGTAEEHEYDRLQRKQQWEQIVAKSCQQAVQSLACQKVVRLAQYRLGQVGREAVYECLADSRQVLTSPTAALMMSDVYIQIGMANMAQRAAFESLTKGSDVSTNARAFRRLVETAVITRQYDLALKYIALLEESSAHRDWARSMREVIKHPTPEYQKLQKSYDEIKDQFFL